MSDFGPCTHQEALDKIDRLDAEVARLEADCLAADLAGSELLKENERLRAALEIIAGHDGPDTTYVWFDEPHSREVARKALANKQEEK